VNFAKKWLTPIVLVVVVGVSFVLLHSRLKHIEDEPAMANSPWALEFATVRAGTVSSGFPALGRVESASDVRLLAQIGGTVEEVGPRAGVNVKPGELLIKLDTRDLEAQAASVAAKVTEVQSAVTHDRNELAREKSLLAEGGSSESAVEGWETRYRADLANEQALQKQLASIRIKISYGRVQAPMAARVSRRPVEIGDTVTPGKLMYQLTSDSGGRVVIPVPQDTSMVVRPGTLVELRSADNKMRVAVSRVSPSLDELSMGQVEIDLPSRPFSLADGAHLAARVIEQQVENTVVVPRDALVPAHSADERYVFKLAKDQPPHIQRTPVHVALCGLEGCAIQAGLSAGDKVVTANGNVLLLLHDGDPVVAPAASVAEQSAP